jgi:ERCC4-type nuclease
MNFIIDSREPRTMQEVMTEAFEREGIVTEVQELPEGDFKYDNIIFERKEINDFVSSIKDGRYKSQKRKLLLKQNEGCHIYYVIHGQPRDLAEENQLSI